MATLTRSNVLTLCDSIIELYVRIQELWVSGKFVFTIGLKKLSYETVSVYCVSFITIHMFALRILSAIAVNIVVIA